ncbi:MAG: sister chromatid cohesion protein 1 [Vezdaea aestivalis]|nr:MAG: sister chromatid cohesion protein 1 [Vezdaea aestivalis]
MFYSETLLSKTGPLARVWLSANLERKLSKTHILGANIEHSVDAIVDEGQAPLALRLSGQLLLGVVRIYSRKARYLLDDCNEALMKLKMASPLHLLAFRPGNVDIPKNQTTTSTNAALNLPDALTEVDLLGPMPDESLLLTQPFTAKSSNGGAETRHGLGRNEDITLMDWDTDLLPASIEAGRGIGAGETLHLENDDLDLDIGEAPLPGAADEDTSIHIGRGGSIARLPDDIMSDDAPLPLDDLDLDIGDGPEDGARAQSVISLDFGLGAPTPGFDLGEDNFDFGIGADSGLGEGFAAPTPGVSMARNSASPLSSLRSSVDRQLDANFRPNETTQLAEESTIQLPARAKRRKILQADADTVIHMPQIKAQQEDRSKILKPASYLPRDPFTLQLLAAQRSGAFVSHVLGDARANAWAPELRGMLSLDAARRAGGDLKRKRDSGVADLEDELAGKGTTPVLEIPDDSNLDEGFVPAPMYDDGYDDAGGDATIHSLHNDARPLRSSSVHSYSGGNSPLPDFDETMAPLVHPRDSGPVARGTQRAVHLLRDCFGGQDSLSSQQPSKGKRASVLFQDLCPERHTSKADATKLFFEVLVLATKDAVKVEQTADALGSGIKVRAKRGLWGGWAERDGGEEEEQPVLTQGARMVEVEA